MDPWFDPAWFFLAGHLIHAEQNPLRKALLFLFARYIELPMLRLGYLGTRGSWRAVTENRWSRALLKYGVAWPIGRYIDTGHPMLTADVLALLDAQDTAIAIGPCRCRLVHKECRHRLETDMVIRTGTTAFTKAFPKDYRAIDRTEAKTLIRTFAAEGLFHMVFLHLPTARAVNEYALCNCCSCGCVPFLLNKTFGQDGFPLVRGEHIAALREDLCEACGDCLAVCPWEARQLDGGRLAIDLEKCFGCGLCARRCKNGAIEMRRVRPRPPLRTDRDIAL